MASVGSAPVGFACPMFPGQVFALGENSKKILSLGKKLQHIKIPLVSIVDDNRSVADAIFSLIKR
jgi:hypothetical protein